MPPKNILCSGEFFFSFGLLFRCELLINFWPTTGNATKRVIQKAAVLNINTNNSLISTVYTTFLPIKNKYVLRMIIIIIIIFCLFCFYVYFMLRLNTFLTDKMSLKIYTYINLSKCAREYILFLKYYIMCIIFFFFWCFAPFVFWLHFFFM